VESLLNPIDTNLIHLELARFSLQIQHFVQLRMLSCPLRSRSAIFRAQRLESFCLGGNYRESTTNRAIFRISIFASEWVENVENGPKTT